MMILTTKEEKKLTTKERIGVRLLEKDLEA